MATEEAAPPSLPQYPELILAAIESASDKNGLNKSSISKHIEATYGNLPAAHSTLLSYHLNNMKQSGQLIMLKNNYLKPDPDAPPRRGRGRPPKPKDPLPPGTVVSPPRPRGRPPKTVDPLAPPVSQPKKIAPPESGRKRGRPPKTVNTTMKVAPVADGARRGRGRPPKAKMAAAPVGA
ncbi:hypothetical protein LguiA_000684 [Lonicera macranthoides]